MFDQISLKWQRPDDYFAEMIKSDSHMLKIKNKLMEEKKRMETIEHKKKEREMKKYGKQIQQKRLQEKAQEKKTTKEALTKLRKGNYFPFIMLLTSGRFDTNRQFRSIRCPSGTSYATN